MATIQRRRWAGHSPRHRNAMKVLVVDDHSAIRSTLRQLIELKDDFRVVGEGANGVEAITAVDELQPDIVLMDMNMPVMDGVEATKTIKLRHPHVKVLALTAFGDMSLVSSMVRAGASGYLLKGGSANELLEGLEAVARGQAALDREVTKGVMEDVAELYGNEQERADALAELDRMKSEFISVVSHELRTPLTSIKGGVATLRAQWATIDEEVKFEFLDSIAKQCDRLARMVTQILTVSGLQRGGLGLHPTTFSVACLAYEALDALAGRAAGREVVVELEADVEATGDRARIQEVAGSLIENALAFTTGRVTIRIESDDGTPKLHVEDEGPGLDDATVARLLDKPFTQGDSSTTRAVGGLGLSLYIAKQVLAASGGRLDVRTSPDGGSTFTMVLAPPPAVAPAHAQTA